jgi:FlaA1/EpsC-like NDP-sugar epimerase
MDLKTRPKFSRTLDVWLSNLSRTRRSSKQAVSISVDLALVVLALWAAFSLRNGTFFHNFSGTWHLFLLLPIATVIIFMSLGIYRWVVRSSNANLFYQLVKACTIASVFLVLLTFLAPPNGHIPRSLFVIFGMLVSIFTCGVRYIWQGLFDSGARGEPVAIYGAGSAGRQLLHSFSQGTEYRPVIFIDDNPALLDTFVAGIPVIPSRSGELKNQLFSFEIERVILAMPSISASEYEAKVRVLQQAGMQVQTIPTYSELVSGTAVLHQVRDISMTDILGRSEIPPNPELLGKCIKSKVVMVTGGGGSIGSELCRQIIAQQPRKLIVVDHAEENLYQITEELSAIIGDPEIARNLFLPRLCSVNNESQINALIKNHGVDTVYHAAAYKHVPIIQAQPEQGVRVNIFGTLTVLNAAIENEVENFVLISTDKAVRPTNSMGATKRVAELALQAKALRKPKTVISMVRFGNVLGSSGSVVPKFRKQIEEGGPITLTSPDITRYFMTIPEAAQLVMQASAIARGGDVFVLDMGDPVRIEDLAISMVRMSGKKLARDTGNPKDIEIVIEGLRPGEKMFEELFITNQHKPTLVKKVFTADEQCLDWSELNKHLNELNLAAQNVDRTLLRSLLLDLAFLRQDGLLIESNDIANRLGNRNGSPVTDESEKETSIDIAVH